MPIERGIDVVVGRTDEVVEEVAVFDREFEVLVELGGARGTSFVASDRTVGLVIATMFVVTSLLDGGCKSAGTADDVVAGIGATDVEDDCNVDELVVVDVLVVVVVVGAIVVVLVVVVVVVVGAIVVVVVVVVGAIVVVLVVVVVVVLVVGTPTLFVKPVACTGVHFPMVVPSPSWP